MKSNKIKEVRRNAGYTQKELADKSGLSIASIQGYEQGKYNPKLATVRKLAEALEVTISDLVEDWSLFSAEEFAEDLEKLDKQETKLLTNYRQLNKAGQDEAQRQVEVLTKVPDFQK